MSFTFEKGAESAALPAYDMDKELCALVLDTAPRLFAVVLERGRGTDLADGVVMAWGLADEDGAVQVMDVHDGRSLQLSSPERALWWYGRREDEDVRARLVWLAEPVAAVLDPHANHEPSRAEAA